MKDEADIKTPQELVLQPEVYVVLSIDDERLPSDKYPPDYFGYFLTREDAEAAADAAARGKPSLAFLVMRAVSRYTGITTTSRVEY